MSEETEIRSFYDITYEEDREELAKLIQRGVRLDTTITAPEDLSEVRTSIEDLVRRLGGELIEVDSSSWPKRLSVKFRLGGSVRELRLLKIEEGAYKPELV